ncbi:SLAP domain-containing protein [Lactobacillus sp. LL6]|uniref:SLAP domain-containing protein n=1 Tax=Lactobacillus sp. LL6 TaxID=2596827 RepID=UPI001185168B|nr:SLAP domain-containing protein [Lactobacillus sp. LL6]TSO25721.1 N-acetylmuramidase [Lactobacillus sp. LL6]
MKTKFIAGVATATLLTAAMPAINNLPFVKNANTQKAEAATDVEEAFLNKAAKQAQKAAKTYGVYPSVMIAQAIVESGWGQSKLATEANNLFGMKANDGWDGATYIANTREENSSGKSYYINAAFRKYTSYEGSFDDNGKKLRLGVTWQPDRYKGAWLENASTYAAATKALTGTYATDHRYNISLNNHITTYDLTKYDPQISTQAKSYTVAKSGATYAWPTDHAISAKSGSVSKGQTVTVDKTITYYNGSKRMHIAGKGWVNSTLFENNSEQPAIAVSQAPKSASVKVSKNLMHNAYVYDSKGQRIRNIKMLKADNVIPTYGQETIKGKKYYRVGENQYIAAGNIDGTSRILKHNSYVYNEYGNRDNNLKYKKNQSVATYGSAVTINGQKYYKVGIREYIKHANFAKN